MTNEPPLPNSSPRSTPRLSRVFWALTTLTFAGTFVFSQIDYLRRHQPGLDPTKYWMPQLIHIWIPGTLAATICLILAFVLERRARHD